jgi:DMSO/TMAO reductase YedYZ heme-binding membrane subunit
MSDAPTPDPNDPVVIRRAAILHWSDLAQRIAYLCFGLSVVVFVVAFIAQFPTWTVTTIIGLMVLGSVLFVPAVVLGYAAKAADKEDRGEKFGY